MPKIASKIVFPAALLLALIGIWLIVSQKSQLKEKDATPVAGSTSNGTGGIDPGGDTKKELPSPSIKHGQEPEVNMEAVMQEIDDATTTYSKEAIPVLERYLNSQNPEIRQAAANGLAQMGLSEGAPLLHAAAIRLQVSHPEESKDYEETAKILELPDGTASLKKMSDAAKKAAADGALKENPKPPKIVDGQPQIPENPTLGKKLHELRQQQMQQQQETPAQESQGNQ